MSDLLETLVRREADSYNARQANDAVERHIESWLEPLVAGKNEEAARLEAKCGRGNVLRRILARLTTAR